MDSRIKIIEQLIESGKDFTFKNFCYNHNLGSTVGGEDRAEWLTWKTRIKKIVHQYMNDNTSAYSLVDKAFEIRTIATESDQFDRAKSTFLQALNLTLEALKKDSYGELKETKATAKLLKPSNKVFVVHGHDQALKTDIERFLQEIGLKPIILHRQPDQGQTIIEKFESNSNDVGYAFILLTPDDIAYTIDQEKKGDTERKKEKRARQNVIFEFGYFVGKLGRKGVCCLYKGDVVWPSDLHGLIYKPITDSLDSQAYSIIKELRAAGYSITYDN